MGTEIDAAELAELRRDAERWKAVLKHLGGSVVADHETIHFGVRLPVFKTEMFYKNTAAEFTTTLDAAIGFYVEKPKA